MFSKKTIFFILILGLLNSGIFYGVTIGEAVVTKVQVKSFDEAKAKAVTSVKDGEAVWLWVKFPKPVEQYLHRWEYSDDIEFSDKKVLYLAIGPAGDLSTAWDSYGYILPRQTELKQNVLCVNIAPGEVGPMWIGVWAKTVGTGSPGKWDNELRVYELGDTKNTVNEKNLLAVVPLTADVESGMPKYKAMYQDYERRYQAGDPATNTLPERTPMGDKTMRAKIVSVASDSLGSKVEGFYFIGAGMWFEVRNDLGQLEKRFAFGIIFYRKDGKYYFKHTKVVRWVADGTIEVQMDPDAPYARELSAETYKKGLQSANQ